MRGDLYLASTSPRRSELLRAAGIRFALHPPGHEPEGHGTPLDRAAQRARAKATDAVPPVGEGAILGVDTLVIVDDQELGKPRDRAAAAAMLELMADRDHQVVTAHCLFAPATGKVIEEMVASTVRCAALGPETIGSYLDTDDWTDKAGGYGIQSAAGAFMTLVEGALDTVIGLHVPAVRRLMAAL